MSMYRSTYLPYHQITVWNLVRFYVALLRTVQLSCFATMPDPEPGPVLCFTLVHLFRLRFNLENILATSLPVLEPWLVIAYIPLLFTCSGSVSPWGTFPLRPFLVPRPLPSLSARFHDRSKRHMTCWQSLLSWASSLQFNWNAHSF